MAKKNKYNNKKIEVDGIKFDSLVEKRYYDHLKWLLANGEILSYRLQPRYLLQEGFKKNGVTHRKIEFVADFEVIHIDHSIEVVDIKGMITEAAKIKFKLFAKKYDYKLSLLSYSKIDGGWISVDQLNKNRKLRKKNKSIK